MKNAWKAAVIIGGAMAIKKAVKVSFDSGMGFVIGMALTYEDGEQITVDDAANDLMENGFSFGRVGYYAGIIAGQKNKDLAKILFEN